MWITPCKTGPAMKPKISDFHQIWWSCYLHQEKRKSQILGSNSKPFQNYGNSKIGLKFQDFILWQPSWTL